MVMRTYFHAVLSRNKYSRELLIQMIYIVYDVELLVLVRQRRKSQVNKKKPFSDRLALT